MGLYYNVDVGYSLNSYNNISSFNDLIITDSNRPMVVLTGPFGPNKTVYSPYTPDDFYNLAVESIGSQADTFYSLIITPKASSESSASFLNFTSAFPSIKAAYPNLFEKMLVGDISSGSVFVHYKSLNRLHVVSIGNSGGYAVYDTNSFVILYSGTFTNTTYPGGAFKFGTQPTAIAFAINDPSLPPGETEYGTVFLRCRGNDWCQFNQSLYKQRSELFTSIFGTDVLTPDTPGGGGGEGPYGPGGESGPGTLPPGTFDNTSDPIPDSSLPTLSAANTGFTRIYNPTLSQVQALARYLWTDTSVIDTIWNHIKQFFEDPMEAIIGFNVVPCAVPDAGNVNFALMYIDTGVSMNVAASQFVDVDCGSLTLDRYYGSALDQSPYTKVSCFLPFIGMVQLNTDEVMGTTLNVKYRIDIVSGSCVAKIFIDGNCLYQYSGHCAITIPISSADFSSYVSAAISVAKLAVGAAVAGAAGAFGMAESEMMGTAVQSTGQALAVSGASDAASIAISPSGGPISSAELPSLLSGQSESAGTMADFGGLTPANVTNTVGMVMNSKPHVEHSGSFSGNSGYLGVRYPYVIIERPRQCLPSSYGHWNGYPAMITMVLGECQGFTRIQQTELKGMSATNPEQAEILKLLKGGVYL